MISRTPTQNDFVATMTGDLPGDKLGAVLMHEHVILVDPELEINRPQEWNEAEGLNRAVTDLQAAHERGIDTIVDLTALGLGRNIPRLARIAARTDVNIVVATGYYTWRDLPLWAKRFGCKGSLDDLLTQMFIDEIRSGIADTGIRAGMLKCVTEKYGLTTDVERILRAVATAHIETGVPISTHAHAGTRRGLDQLRVFAQEGVDISKVVIGHCGDSSDLDYLRELADTGASIGMDRFGMQLGPLLEERVATVVRMCELGYSGHMVLSSDYGLHTRMEQEYLDNLQPGHRYSYVPEVVVPRLISSGLSQEIVGVMLCTNPRRILCGTRQGGPEVRS
jgi:phosphotriesterase-related protein